MGGYEEEAGALRELVAAARLFLAHPGARADLEQALDEIDATVGRIAGELRRLEPHWPKRSGPRVKG